MENKEPKRVELNDGALEKVSGGAFVDLEVCPVCGKPKREGMACLWCDMADGVMTCPACGGNVTKEHGCATCGLSWDDYYKNTMWLRGE